MRILLPKSNAFLCEEAARLRQEYEHVETEEDVVRIAEGEGIHVARMYVNFGRSVAFSCGDDNFIAYDGLSPLFRKYAVAHELGHHVAGHPRSAMMKNRVMRACVESFMEEQADLFAYELTGLDFSNDSLSIVRDEREEARDTIRGVRKLSDYIEVEREKLVGTNPRFEEAFPWGDFENYLTRAQKVARN